MGTNIPPRPRSLAETGLERSLIEELITKHLHEGGAVDLPGLVLRLRLPGTCLEEVLAPMREMGRVEFRRRAGESGPHYVLTDKGHDIAKRLLQNNRYVGAAPVPLEQYVNQVKAQTSRGYRIAREDVLAALSDAVIGDHLLDQLGPAVHSGRPVFFYGSPGTGKSYIGKKLARLFKDKIFVPRAISVSDIVISFFDPAIHKAKDGTNASEHALFSEGYDARYVMCDRPLVVTGGELTMDMLEVRYDSSNQLYRMPIHLLANNGLFMVDDLGRHQFSPTELMNRWIIPMEERKDYLFISGQHISVPFDVVLLFATNMNPLDLADEAFLRRIGYKIRFAPLTSDEYANLWRRISTEAGLKFDSSIIDFLREELHNQQGVPLLPCIPRDLMNLSLDYHRYHGRAPELDKETLTWAWDAYFLRLD